MFEVQGVGNQFDDDLNARRVPESRNRGFRGPGSPLSVSRQLNHQIDVFLTGQNLFDQEYFVGTLPTLIGPPRIVSVGLRLRLTDTKASWGVLTSFVVYCGLVRTALSEHQSTSPPVRRRMIAAARGRDWRSGSRAWDGCRTGGDIPEPRRRYRGGRACRSRLCRAVDERASHRQSTTPHNVSAAGASPCAASSLARWRSAAVSSSTIHTRHCSGTRGSSGLASEDVNKAPGDVTYFFGGQHVPESTGSGRNSARSFLRCVTTSGTRQEVPRQTRTTPRTWRLDGTTLFDYLVCPEGPARLLRAVIGEAYIAEYSLKTHSKVV